MFSKNDAQDRPSGQAMMFASAVKMMGLDPKAIEKIQNGLLVDLHVVASMAPEILARLEYLLKSSLPPEGTDFPTAWEAYLKERDLEHGRQLALIASRRDSPANGAGSDSGG